MAETKHTPGPWVPDEGSFGHYVAVKAGKKTIARIPWGEGDGPNAALIAAAPELLAALRVSVERLERLAPVISDPPETTAEMALAVDMCKIRAAIAKAEGRSGNA